MAAALVPAGDANLPRLDVTRQKAQLTALLREKAATYWSLLKRFFQAKLSKTELDNYALSALGPNVQLHNHFILAIIGNARSAMPPPGFVPRERPIRARKRVNGAAGAAGAGGVAANGGAVGDAAKRTAAGALDLKGAAALVARKKQRLHSGQPVVDAARRFRVSAGLIRPTVLPSRLKGVQPAVPLSKRFLGEPALTVLRQRMVRVAREYGVDEVGDDTVALMHRALETHLKDLLHASATSADYTICPANILSALATAPHLLGDATPFARERASLVRDFSSPAANTVQPMQH